MKTWRDSAAPIIANVIATVGLDDVKALRRALRDAYPFGERRYWPYKVWCDEVKKQRGIARRPIVAQNQEELFP